MYMDANRMRALGKIFGGLLKIGDGAVRGYSAYKRRTVEKRGELDALEELEGGCDECSERERELLAEL